MMSLVPKMPIHRVFIYFVTCYTFHFIGLIELHEKDLTECARAVGRKKKKKNRNSQKVQGCRRATSSVDFHKPTKKL